MRIGFMWTDGAMPAASACKAWARPISRPSMVAAEFSDMFWDLNGATAPKKSQLLKSEGVEFDSRGIITDTRKVFDGFQVKEM